MAQKFHESLEVLLARVARLTARVQQVVDDAAEAVFNADVALARSVIEADRHIDDEEVKVEAVAINLLALYSPAASDLRLVTTIIKANNDFERIADSAVNAAQRVLPLANDYQADPSSNGRADPPYQPPKDLRLMVNGVVEMLRTTIRAFNLNDEALAKQVVRSDDVNDALYHQVLQEVLSDLAADGTHATRDLAFVMIAKNFERIGDHCTNIAEDVVYARTGRIIRHAHAV